MQIVTTPVGIDVHHTKGSTGGSRPPSRVRVTFFESEKPLAVSTPDSDTIDYDISNMTTHPATPNDTSTPNNYSRHLSVESGWDNPFRPDGDLSKEADQIVELIKEGKPINDETLRSMSPLLHSTNYTNNLTASPPSGKNGSANGMEVQRGVVVPPSATGAVEHVNLKKKKGCCVIQ